MNYRKILQIFVLLSPIAFIFAFAPIFPVGFGLCENRLDFDCQSWYEDHYGATSAIIIFSSPIVFLVSLLALVKMRSEATFHSWKRFAKAYLFVALIIALLSVVFPSRGSWGLPGFFDLESTTWFLASLFLLLSLLLIAIKSRALRKKKK